MSSETAQDRDRDFTSLEAWKKAREVKRFFYQKILPKLPPEEKYNLNIQIRKASVSGTANIAEGYGRFYYTEGVQFYRITRGSLTELKDHLLSCYDLTYISKVFCDEGMLLLDTARKLLNGYSNYTLAQIKAEKNE